MSCLFDSLSRFIQDERVDGGVLRHILCEYLKKNNQIMEDLSVADVAKTETGLDLDNYVEKMRYGSTFGGAIEIRAFTKVFKLNVLVKSIPNNKDIEFIENEKYKWATISWTGNHFEAIG